MPASLPEVFFEKASAVLAANPALVHEWIVEDSGKRTLKVPAIDPNGFSVEIQAESYGLYPYAGGWHGAPWDVNTPKMSIEEICEDCLGFVRSLLCGDSSLKVLYSNGHAYKWILTYPFSGKPYEDSVGLLVFNYFGRRSMRTFQNRHLPSRETSNSVPSA